ncbi:MULTISPECIES: helix-turn-helix domain-containing protein [Streptosporangiaceae]|uniref:helix-turn-helix domain-containing protein n=1 Tax=Streptosporangiaceae TaxID=2004 RepID=UPI0033DFBA53
MHEAPHSVEPPAEPPPEVETLLYTPEQAAEIVNLSRFWLVKEAREGRISHHRVGKLYRFSRENLDEIKTVTAQPARRGA